MYVLMVVVVVVCLLMVGTLARPMADVPKRYGGSASVNEMTVATMMIHPNANPSMISLAPR